MTFKKEIIKLVKELASNENYTILTKVNEKGNTLVMYKNQDQEKYATIEIEEIEFAKEILAIITTEVEETVDTFGIIRTGNKMLTSEEEIAMGYSVKKELISSFVTNTDKDKEVEVRLYNTGVIQYNYIINGESNLKNYFINTPEFKYVYEENKRYKSKLPKWLNKEQLKAMY